MEEQNQPKLDQSGGVAVIVAFYDGYEFIDDQLRSIINQTYQPLKAFVFDDQSSKLLADNASFLDDQAFRNVTVISNSKRQGFARNFIIGLSKVSDEFEYFAFSDQDDVWFEGKIEKAVDELKLVPKEIPALYCATTEIWDRSLSKLEGCSVRIPKGPSFKNALVQSIAGGNTMVLNRAARDLVVRASMSTIGVSHDWWCYQIVSGADGRVIRDSQPCLKYRQHDKNIVGARVGWGALFERLKYLIKGQFRSYLDVNLQALNENRELLSTTNVKTLDNFVKLRRARTLKRIYMFLQSGIHRQTAIENWCLFIAVIFRKA